MTDPLKKNTHTFIEKSRARNSWCCGQPLVGWVRNKGVNISWDASPVSSPATVLIHCGKVKVNPAKHEVPILIKQYCTCIQTRA